MWGRLSLKTRQRQPIALYELGMLIREGGSLVIGTDPGYVRRTNVVTQLALARPEPFSNAALRSSRRSPLRTVVSAGRAARVVHETPVIGTAVLLRCAERPSGWAEKR